MTGQLILKGAAEKVAERYGLDPKEVLAQAEQLLGGLHDGETGR